MSSIRLPLRRSDSNIPSTSTEYIEQDQEMYSLPYNNNHRSQPYGQHSSRKKANQHHRYHHQHRHHNNGGRRQHRTDRTPSEHESHRDDDDLFENTATNLLSSLKQPSKMTFNWSRQFNETLATISGLLQRNFQENPSYPGCNVSEASASTATLGSTTQMDALSKVQAEKWQKNRRTSASGGDPRELDILVREKNNDDDSDDY